MPLSAAKVVIGALYIVVRTLLKLTKLPDADRADLEKARDELEQMMGEMAMARTIAERFVDAVLKGKG